MLCAKRASEDHAPLKADTDQQIDQGASLCKQGAGKRGEREEMNLFQTQGPPGSTEALAVAEL